MTHLLVIGLDPGPTTGVAALEVTGDGILAYCYQCNQRAVTTLAESLIGAGRELGTVIAAGERFIDGRGPGARGANASATRAVIRDVDGLAAWHWRSAAEVKPWATDKRLEKAGLLRECHGMPHAADACRHAIFCAIHDAGLPDPLSRDWPALGIRALTREELTP